MSIVTAERTARAWITRKSSGRVPAWNTADERVPLSPWLPRAAAFAIDTGLSGALALICSYLSYAIWPIDSPHSWVGFVAAVIEIVSYMFLLPVRFRATPGKLLVGIEVTSLDGSQPSLWQYVERTLCLGTLPFALFPALYNENRQHLGDLAASTRVVQARAELAPWWLWLPLGLAMQAVVWLPDPGFTLGKLYARSAPSWHAARTMLEGRAPSLPDAYEIEDDTAAYYVRTSRGLERAQLVRERGAWRAAGVDQPEAWDAEERFATRSGFSEGRKTDTEQALLALLRPSGAVSVRCPEQGLIATFTCQATDARGSVVAVRAFAEGKTIHLQPGELYDADTFVDKLRATLIKRLHAPIDSLTCPSMLLRYQTVTCRVTVHGLATDLRTQVDDRDRPKLELDHLFSLADLERAAHETWRQQERTSDLVLLCKEPVYLIEPGTTAHCETDANDVLAVFAVSERGLTVQFEPR